MSSVVEYLPYCMWGEPVSTVWKWITKICQWDLLLTGLEGFFFALRFQYQKRIVFEHVVLVFKKQLTWTIVNYGSLNIWIFFYHFICWNLKVVWINGKENIEEVMICEKNLHLERILDLNEKINENANTQEYFIFQQFIPVHYITHK